MQVAGFSKLITQRLNPATQVDQFLGPGPAIRFAKLPGLRGACKQKQEIEKQQADKQVFQSSSSSREWPVMAPGFSSAIRWSMVGVMSARVPRASNLAGRPT